jgi:hypothetical protein
VTAAAVKRRNRWIEARLTEPSLLVKKIEQNQPWPPESLHYTGRRVWRDLNVAVMRGGGWDGSVSLSCLTRIFWSAFSSVKRLRMRVRPSTHFAQLFAVEYEAECSAVGSHRDIDQSPGRRRLGARSAELKRWQWPTKAVLSPPGSLVVRNIYVGPDIEVAWAFADGARPTASNLRTRVSTLSCNAARSPLHCAVPGSRSQSSRAISRASR